MWRSGVAYIPRLLVLFNLLAHIAELRVGGDVGWILRSLGRSAGNVLAFSHQP